VFSMSFSLSGSLQDVPVPGKIMRRNSLLSISFLLYGSLQNVPMPGKIVGGTQCFLCLSYSMVPCRMFLCQGR
jgi:hypothetical protein